MPTVRVCTGLFFADFWFGPVTVPARPRHDLLGATAAVLTDFGAARGEGRGEGTGNKANEEEEGATMLVLIHGEKAATPISVKILKGL